MKYKTFQQKELEILREAVDRNQKNQGKKKLNNPNIKHMIEIVETFLRKHKRVCYGGTAINNILPLEAQFYDKDVEIPDYDFFSPTPLKDVKKLANIFYKEGFEEVSAQAGLHPGTFKIFVNFIPVADITELVPELFKNIKKDALSIEGIYYSPPNFLRMLAYLELSRPLGDLSRWEKVLKRINLLNKYYPLKGVDCDLVDIQRLYNPNHRDDEDEKIIFNVVRESLIHYNCVFFGALASKLILKYLPHRRFKNILNTPDFDVLCTDPKKIAKIIKEKLKKMKYNVIIKKHKKIGEIIGEHYEILIGKESIVFLYKPIGCLSYNIVRQNNQKIKIATIDVLLNLYLGFLYTSRPYYDDKRILCISEFLFKAQQKNRLKQKGLLRRFNIDCYGNQKTLEDLRSEKSQMYNKLKKYRNQKKWDYYFLRYQPSKKKKRRKRRRKTRKKKRGYFW